MITGQREWRGLLLSGAMVLVCAGAADAQIRTGSYVGDGTDNRAITGLGFQPDVVIVKGDALLEAVCRTSTMPPDSSKFMGSPGSALVADRIQSLDANGFTVGADPQVNGAATNYYWVAFRATPGVMKVGSYTGNGADNRSITGIGFAPSWVAVMPATANRAAHRSSSMTGDTTAFFSASANGIDLIQALEADGFQVGANVSVNTPGVTYHYMAWRALPGIMQEGTYTGNGVDNRNITGVGFQPEFVIVKAATSERGAARPASLAGDSSIYFNPDTNLSNKIQALQADGFQVGNGVHVNTSAVVYYWMAFAFAAPANYRSIGTAGNYIAGSVSTTNGSYVVTGTSTTWKSANRGRGDRFTVDADGVDYTILSVDSDTQFTLTSPYAGTTGSGKAYTIARKFTTLAAWNDCIKAVAACPGVTTASLVADNRREVGIAYKESTFALGAMLDFTGATTDSFHDVVLTADAGNRHHGAAGNGVVINVATGFPAGILVGTAFVTLEWLEIRHPTNAGVKGIRLPTPAPSPNKVVIRACMIHDLNDDAVEIRAAWTVDLYNNILYDTDQGILLEVATTARIFSNTVYKTLDRGIVSAAVSNPNVTLRNNITHSNPTSDFAVPGVNAASSNNLAGDGTGTTHSPGGGGLDNVLLASLQFASTTVDAENLHIGGGSAAANVAADLSSVFAWDVDGGARAVPWDIGADDVVATTSVVLASFTASGRDGSVVLEWETASELNNLGFHLYRASASGGSYVRITTRAIPGLGSSPSGARYRYTDSGLVNGGTYFYRLEDVESTGRTEIHGPLSAVPQAGVVSEDPTPVVTFGDTGGVELRMLRRTRERVVLELVTPGFEATPLGDGSVGLEIPGFVEEQEGGAPALPVRRVLLDAVPSRNVRVASAEESDVVEIAMTPASASTPEISADAAGVVKASRRRTRPVNVRGSLFPQEPARIVSVSLSGEDKNALLELAPLRWDGASGKIRLARRLVVTVVFDGSDPAETARARRRGRRQSERGRIVARLSTTERGLYGVRYEDLFGRGRGRSLPSSLLRLSRGGEPTAFHVEPSEGTFAPGSVLYFLSPGEGANPYGREAVYELELGRVGKTMPVVSGRAGGADSHVSIHRLEREENRLYQAGLLQAPDPWLWDLLFAPDRKSFSFEVSHRAPSGGTARLSLRLQGASDLKESPDHHVRVYLNQSLVQEARWDGKHPVEVEAEVPLALLRDGENEVEIENVGDTDAAYSMVMLDRFAVAYPRKAVAEGGKLEGRWLKTGLAEVLGVSSGVVLDVTEPTPSWLSEWTSGSGSLGFGAEAGRDYVVVSWDAVLRPDVRRLAPSDLRRLHHGADLLVVGSAELLPATGPLLELRRSEGLRVKTVATEDIYEEFGFGEPRPEAIRSFLEFAYHEWRGPAFRYVLLVGDATYDFKDYLGTGVKNQVPPMMVKTTYLWTASDPAYAAVNGEDEIPDVAIGRLPGSTIEEVRTMVDKIVAARESAGARAPAVLVADDPDAAGDFVANAEAIARLVEPESVRRIYLSELGVEATRAAIVEAFDQGASLVSYVGHGGIHLWASENLLDTARVRDLRLQTQQPILLTMNCLNGYFHFPFFDSLAEDLLKAEGKGVIAAFSPSGLSLDDPAHVLHTHLVRELRSGAHERLGDAVLAAQKAYAASGVFPELLRIYHLLGDPSLRLPRREASAP